MAKRDKKGLSTKQAAALPLVIEGRRDSEIAKALGVARQTVCNWRNQDPRFIAAVNAMRAETLEAARARLQNLVGDALAALADAARQGDLRAALFVLKALDLDSVPPPGPTEPAEIILERAAREAIEALPDESFEAAMSLFTGNFAEREKWAEERARELAQEYGVLLP